MMTFLTRALADMSLRWRDVVRRHEAARVLRRCASVGSGTGLRMPVVIYHPEGLRLGSQVSIGEFTHIRASGGVTIGDRVLIASHVVITSRGHRKEPARNGMVVDAPVVIEDDVWIAAGAIILPGAHVSRGAIVAAGAVVNGMVDPMCIVGGVPARKIGEIQDDSVRG